VAGWLDSNHLNLGSSNEPAVLCYRRPYRRPGSCAAATGATATTTTPTKTPAAPRTPARLSGSFHFSSPCAGIGERREEIPHVADHPSHRNDCSSSRVRAAGGTGSAVGCPGSGLPCRVGRTTFTWSGRAQEAVAQSPESRAASSSPSCLPVDCPACW
jgi:hypothetical protein